MSDHFSTVGKAVNRLDVPDKAFGKTKYTNDISNPSILHAKLHTSQHAHATINSIDTSEALKVSGVHAILTGEDFPYLLGPMLADRPPLL